MPSHGDLMKSSDSFVSSPSLQSLNKGLEGDMSLHAAAVRGDVKTLDTLFRNGANVNEILEDGSTPLSCASYYGHAACVKFLLNHNAKTEIQDANGNMPLHLAVKKNHKKVVMHLVAYGADLDARGGTGLSPVHTAAKYGYDKVLQVLLESGASADRYTDNDNPRHPLHMAAARGHASTLKIILQYNERFTEPLDGQGRTPLFLAVLRNHSTAVLALALAKAQVNAPDKSGRLPIEIAVDQGFDDICHTLCEHGADVSLRYAYPRKELVHNFTLDRYGQIIADKTDIIGDITKIGTQARSLQAELSRAKQWERMIKHWSKYAQNKKEKIRKRVARGIPDCVRGQVWKLLCGYSRPIESGEYKVLRGHESPWAHQIDLDVTRAFRNHIMYYTRYGKGQCSLFYVLKSYSNYDEELGYCQGMGDVCGMLVKYFQERECFSVYDIMMREPKYDMRGCFLNDFPKLQRTFYVHGKLIECISPALSDHLIGLGALTPLYATRWYLTIFLDIFPHETTLRVWDLFFMDGFDILFSVAMAILKIFEDELLHMQFEQIMIFMHTLGERTVDADEFVHYIVEHRISTRSIRKLEQAYEEFGDPEGLHTMRVNK